MDPAAMTDRQLFVLAFATRYDEEPNRSRELDREIERRFGEHANDQLATLITAAHMSTEDTLTWAAENPEQCIEAAKTGTVKAWEKAHAWNNRF